jgi:ABC-2 type transport system ATP-binding protein
MRSGPEQRGPASAPGLRRRTGGAAFRTSGLTRRFGETVAVSDLDLEAAAGEVLGLLGHNGAGKTTTIRLLNGVLRPTTGGATVLHLDPWHDGRELRRRTGVLPESPSLDLHTTARRNLAFHARLFDVAADRVDEVLATFDLEEVTDRPVGGFSKGMRQRLALARTLLHEPDLLLLDEPTAALDPVGARQVRDLIDRTARERGRTVVLSTHNLVEAAELCDRVAVLERGRLLAVGPPTELRERVSGPTRVQVVLDSAARDVLAGVLARLAPDATATWSDGVAEVDGLDRGRIPDLVTGLAAAGARIHAVRPVEPSLEEIYFALHGDGR